MSFYLQFDAMNKVLYEYLESLVCIDSMETICRSISMIGPYVSGISFAEPVTVGQLKPLTSSATRRSYYRNFSIPKKSGAMREILAPDGLLKDILSTFAFMLSVLYESPKNVMAFTRNRSIVDNAREHCGHNYVLNLDLKDFFTTIVASDVERGLRRLGIPADAARIFSRICTYPRITSGSRVVNVLPQGSPASPILSNICATTLDQRLNGLAKRFHLTFTRYADDMTFSSNHNVYHEKGDFMTELYKIINECGFTINPLKTRLQKRGARQEVTGLNVSDHVNVTRKFIKNLRAAIHRLTLSDILLKHDVNVIRGKINFLRMVKGNHDSTYLSLLLKFNLAVKGKHYA